MSLLPSRRAARRATCLRAVHFSLYFPLFAVSHADAPPADRFVIHSSARFEIHHDSSPAKARLIGDIAEAVCDDVYRWAGGLKMPTRPIQGRMRVDLFANWNDYSAMAGRHGFVVDELVPGFFDQQGNRGIVFDYANSKLIRQKRAEIDDALRRATNHDDMQGGAADSLSLELARKAQQELAAHEEMINQTVFRHEIAHQVLFNLGLETSGPNRRRWLAEGLAMQFETPRPPNVYRLDDFLEAGKRPEPISVRTLLTSADCMGPGAARLQDGYATAWALVHYLRERYPEELRRYLGAALATTAPSNDRAELARFETAFGAVNVEFEYRFRTYFTKHAESTSAPTKSDGE